MVGVVGIPMGPSRNGFTRVSEECSGEALIPRVSGAQAYLVTEFGLQREGVAVCIERSLAFKFAPHQHPRYF